MFKTALNKNITPHTWKLANIVPNPKPNSKQSSLIDVISGVPQGTVLGPLLFLLHINDLSSVVSSKVRLFADDCLIYRNIKNKEDQIALQKDLNLLENWGNTWGMRFNAAKCNVMRVARTRDQCRTGIKGPGRELFNGGPF